MCESGFGEWCPFGTIDKHEWLDPSTIIIIYENFY
jgi:hypothetical protein